MNLLELLKPSDKTALIQGKKSVSFLELLEGGLSFGEHLRQKGMGIGSRILIFMPLSIDLYTAIIGMWGIGAVPVFIDFSAGAYFVDSSAKRLKLDMIVCDGLTQFVRYRYPELRKLKSTRIKKSIANDYIKKMEEGDSLTEKNNNFTEKNNRVIKLENKHPALLTFTSGTTGFPKIACRTHGFLLAQYNVISEHLHFGESNIELGTLPIFILANLAAHSTTLLPYKSYVPSAINAKKLIKKMEYVGVNRAICSPALMEKLLKHSNLPGLKSIYLGGAPVYPGLLNIIKTDVHIVYGSTEAEPIASIRWADICLEDKHKIKCGAGLLVGKIVPQIECRIAENNEILVSGETVLKGYLDGIGDDESKIHADNKIWHKTGDAGHIDEQGRLWLLGRISQAIYDANGTLYPFCAECILDAVFGIRGAILAQNGKRVIIVESGKANKEKVLEALKPLHISEVGTVKRLPMDKRHNGKIDYAKLKEMLI